MNPQRRRHLITTGSLLAGACGIAQAQPSLQPLPETLTMVVGFPPGGALDNLARVLGERLRGVLAASIVIDNRPGASSRISIEHVKRSAPDGRTILLASGAPFTIFPLTYKRLGYDLNRDFVSVAHLVDVPTVVSAGSVQPYQTIGQYVDWVRANRSRNGVGLTNLGGALHFAILAMSKSIGVPLAPVPYKGGAPLATDLIGGHVPVGTDALASQLALYRSGKLRVLGVSGKTRSPVLPDIPTLQEAGIGGFEYANAMYSAFLPAATPPAIVQRVEQALLDALAVPDVQAQIRQAGLEPTGYSGSRLATMLRAERDFWRPIVESSGFSSDE